MTALQISIVAAAAFLAGLMIVSIRRTKTLERACCAAFDGIYASTNSPPRLTVHPGYGTPVFLVEFADEAALQAARSGAANESFVDAVQAVYADKRHRGEPFDARKAIFFTYEGYLDRRLAELGEGVPDASTPPDRRD
jgi:hypothetical protein